MPCIFTKTEKSWYTKNFRKMAMKKANSGAKSSTNPAIKKASSNPAMKQAPAAKKASTSVMKRAPAAMKRLSKLDYVKDRQKVHKLATKEKDEKQKDSFKDETLLLKRMAGSIKEQICSVCSFFPSAVTARAVSAKPSDADDDFFIKGTGVLSGVLTARTKEPYTMSNVLGEFNQALVACFALGGVYAAGAKHAVDKLMGLKKAHNLRWLLIDKANQKSAREVN